MCHANNKKRIKPNNGRNRIAKSRKNKNVWRNGKLLVLGNIGSRHHQTSKDERKIKIRESQTNEKTSRNQARPQESHQNDKHLGCFRCKIIRSILGMDDGRASTNGSEYKKANDDA